ncbi:LPP20 lipoprotein [Marinomonas polaris DSM 16579]|uniref:LPP20 lipoprotein n=1 Tax=Marinomonas polaris DSM 16579 TaxID=1122206 RepID=A0A1M5NG64_9GAMM|nr:LPP20 family lipoprotein [Marinomonas polaris]SHG88467.1 LPP20 lipoprotein [Marinomonas polaris DSM 16579]
MKNRLILVFLTLLLSACQSIPGLEPSMPDWWVSPPEDSAKWLYGLGEGPNLNAANQQALSNIAGKLQTKISSSLSRRTQETTVSSSDYIDRQLSSEIEKVSLSHFETLKTETLSHRVMTLVRVDKEALANDWSRQLQVIENDLEKILSDKQSGRFAWWMGARSFTFRAAEGDRLASLISGLTGVDQGAQFSQQLSNAISKNKPSVIIKGDQTVINRAITAELLSQELRVGGCKKCDLVINYDTKFSSKVLFGESIVKMDFSGTLTDNSGDISSDHWSISASSVSGLDVGKKATLSMAVQKIKGEGLWKIFGMETK